MIRVAHVAQQLKDGGGMERLLEDFARAADRTRFELRFVALAERGAVADRIEAMGWPVMALGLRPGVRPAALARIAGWLAREGVEVVHTHNTRPLLYAGPAARMAGVRGVIHTRHGQRHGSTRRQTMAFALAARCADRVVSVSKDAARRSYREGIPASAIRAIPGGIDLTRFRVGPGAPEGPVVYVGRLAPEKDLATLLRAAAVAAWECPSLRLVLAGTGRCEDELGALASTLGLGERVTFLGEVSSRDVASLLSRAAVFVLPSLTEGMPLTVLEAMACGVPVVATAVGGVPEAVKDGVTGFLVPPRDAGALAAALVRVLRDPAGARSMGLAGHERATARFGVDRMVRRYERLYAEVVAERRGAEGSAPTTRLAA